MFDIGELYFVYVSELTKKQWMSSNLYELKEEYEALEHLGHTYYIKEDEKGTMLFAFTFIGSKVLVSNNTDFFFAYLEDLKNKKDIFQNAAKAFGDIFGEKTEGSDLVMYLDRESIDNLYFRNYWVYEGPAQYGRNFDCIMSEENLLSRIIFPFPHILGLRHKFYRLQMDGYLEFIKRHIYP